MIMRQMYETDYEVVFYLGEFGRGESYKLYTLLESLYDLAYRQAGN
jgi:hypothetical protein